MIAVDTSETITIRQLDDPAGSGLIADFSRRFLCKKILEIFRFI